MRRIAIYVFLILFIFSSFLSASCDEFFDVKEKGQYFSLGMTGTFIDPRIGPYASFTAYKTLFWFALSSDIQFRIEKNDSIFALGSEFGIGPLGFGIHYVPSKGFRYKAMLTFLWASFFVQRLKLEDEKSTLFGMSIMFHVNFRHLLK